MKKIVSLFLLAVCITAQSQNSNKAKELLDQVTAQAKSYKNMKIDFKYSLVNSKENIKQESAGDVTLMDNQYVLNFMGVTKICDGKKIYTIAKEDQEISISSVDKNKEEKDTPAKMLSFFNKGFSYAMDITQNIKGKKIQYVKLIPLDKKDNRKQILVGIDLATKQVYNTISEEKNGTKITLTVNSFKINQTLSKNQFTFVQKNYPNYYINKLD